MKARKYLATLLSAAMLLSLLSTGALAEENNDLAPSQTTTASTLPQDATDSWAADSITRWTESGVVKGDSAGNFNPEANLTRGELAQTFVNMLGLTEKAENTFSDLESTDWYADAVLKCAAAGLMQGDGKRINGESNITRQETIVMFGRAVGVAPASEPDLSQFTDADSVASWAAGYMAPLAEMGILSGGGDGSLNAAGNIDRASTMALLDKSVAEYVNAPGEYHVDNAKGFVIVNVAAKEGEVVLSGTTAGVAVSAGTAEGKIVAKDLKAATIKVDGAAAVSVEGKSSVGEVVANAAGEITVAKDVTVDTITANGKGTVDNAGTVKSMVSNGTGTVTNSGTVESLVANSTGTVTNSGTVNSLVANSTGAVSNTGTVKELVANAPATIDNKGTVTNADIKVDGVVIDGKKPTQTVVPEGVQPPTDSAGKELPSVKPEDAKPADQIPAPKPETPNVPSGPSRADIVVTAQDFGVFAETIDGASVGFALSGTQLFKIKTVEVSLYSGSDLLATNTAKDIEKFEVAGNFSTPFIVSAKGFDAANDEYWTYGDFAPTVDQAPTKAVITVTDVNGYSYSATNTTFTGTWAALFHVVADEAALIAALTNRDVSLITLGDDITLAAKLKITTALTLDLAGKTLTMAGETGKSACLAIVGEGASLTLNDGKASGAIVTASQHKGAGSGMIELNDGGTMIMNGGTIKADFDSADMDTAQKEGRFAVTVFNDSSFTMNGGEIVAGWYAVSTNGTSNPDNGNYGNNAIMIINDGTLTSTGDYAIYAPAKDGRTEINGGTIQGAWGAIQINNGTLDMTGGDLYNTGAETGTKPSDQTDGSSPDKQTVVSAKGAYGETTVTISGGSLNSAAGQEVFTKTNATVSITGVTSTHKIPDEYCAAGYESVGSDTSWTVTEKADEPPVLNETVTLQLTDENLKEQYDVNLETTEENYCEYSWAVQFTCGDKEYRVETGYYKPPNDASPTPAAKTLAEMETTLQVITGPGTSSAVTSDVALSIDGKTLTWTFTRLAEMVGEVVETEREIFDITQPQEG